MYRNIDFTKFLPVQGCYEYLLKNFPQGLPNDGGDHPTVNGHKHFAEEIILPYLLGNIPNYKNIDSLTTPNII